ncbi:uncharacterized protein Z519_12186 [Cladophialophora bantiana CBS 173.52]|uniref:NAD(P)-binding domain-containing protein n=1 Tax=Cladophialophora bantiana (strain ATCC 10958 / CBS 173.52 / CDC B-1940 / NIH 8579) TaxID=1442370 RepID=A0A0D2H1W9_CLAB1|nr:uncharacterized protein Z519_12186 [Cladophialophora bantiana CBS 173.52]KIW87283.1 hypothetical protein Z519_12186 [Cladophialophora bantiana CBS 173.52]
MASNRRIFLVGPGFIGGEVLDLLVAENYGVTTMVGRESAALSLKKAGSKVILASLGGKDKIREQVEQVGIVFHTATADDLPSVGAVLEGIEARSKASKSTIYAHTSGASLLGDDSSANFKSDTIYCDDKPEDIDALSDIAPHRLVDLAILEAKQQLGKMAKIAIMIRHLSTV